MTDVAEPDLLPLIECLLEGNHGRAVEEVRRLTDAGVAPDRIVTQGLEVAMTRLDEKCTVEGFNLLEIMLAGRAVSGVVNTLYPEGEPPAVGKATFVIATLEGDIHDLGKNIVKMVLIGRGYRVVDLGRDTPVEAVAEAAEREGARAVLVSGLITAVIPQVRKVRGALDARGLRDVPVVAGGAALKQATAESLGVDFVAETAFDGARFLAQRFGAASQ